MTDKFLTFIPCKNVGTDYDCQHIQVVALRACDARNDRPKRLRGDCEQTWGRPITWKNKASKHPWDHLFDAEFMFWLGMKMIKCLKMIGTETATDAMWNPRVSATEGYSPSSATRPLGRSFLAEISAIWNWTGHLRSAHRAKQVMWPGQISWLFSDNYHSEHCWSVSLFSLRQN